MKEIDPKGIPYDPFLLFAHPAVAVVEAEGKRNAITIAWGALGNLWSVPCVFVFIKTSRYSHDLFEKADGYSVCLLEKKHADLWKYFGRVSGRDEDKIGESGLTLLHEDGIPYFKESKLVIVGKKLLSTALPSEDILDPAIREKYYPDGSHHSMYVARIVKAFVE
ncbi:MAG: flavin reductase [Bacilli bacterium]|jgi:flavin reductase (DIM6/NTAB) family NADH-FMN oxidoreductase RutF|nr:flavin reductase [Bacilli bacterium]